jgi:hypothetical protein
MPKKKSTNSQLDHQFLTLSFEIKSEIQLNKAKLGKQIIKHSKKLITEIQSNQNFLSNQLDYFSHAMFSEAPSSLKTNHQSNEMENLNLVGSFLNN